MTIAAGILTGVFIGYTLRGLYDLNKKMKALAVRVENIEFMVL